MWHDDYAGLMNLLCLPIVYAIKGVICRHYIIPLLLEKFDNLVSNTLWKFRRTWNVTFNIDFCHGNALGPAILQSWDSVVDVLFALALTASRLTCHENANKRPKSL